MCYQHGYVVYVGFTIPRRGENIMATKRNKWTLSERHYGVKERWDLSNEQMKKLLLKCTVDKYMAEVGREVDEKIYDAVESYESRPHQPASRDEIEFACIMYMINDNQEGWHESVIDSDACETIGQFIIAHRDIYALGIITILHKCLPLEEIETFRHHWVNTNYCGCEDNEIRGNDSCYVHFASELISYIFDLSSHDDYNGKKDLPTVWKDWRSQMTNAEYETIKKYIGDIVEDYAEVDARWNHCVDLLDGKPSSLFDYSSNHWLVDGTGEPYLED